jgi:hypothetical protein
MRVRSLCVGPPIAGSRRRPRQALSRASAVPTRRAGGVHTPKGKARKKRSTAGRTSPEYRIKVAFRVPLEYAFGWCTDYTPEDGALEGESYARKIIERGERRVVFEDLEDSDSGWIWGRDVVTLRPPNRWHMEGVGSRRHVVADYALRRLPEGRTELELRWRRTPTMPEIKPLTKAEREAEAVEAWEKFAAAMEADYRSGKPARR